MNRVNCVHLHSHAYLSEFKDDGNGPVFEIIDSQDRAIYLTTDQYAALARHHPLYRGLLSKLNQAEDERDEYRLQRDSWKDECLKLKDVIREVEWIAQETDGEPICAWCGGMEYAGGHEPGCQRQKALGET